MERLTNMVKNVNGQRPSEVWGQCPCRKALLGTRRSKFYIYDILHYSVAIQGSNRSTIQNFKHTALAGLWIVVQKLQKLGAFAWLSQVCNALTKTNC